MAMMRMPSPGPRMVAPSPRQSVGGQCSVQMNGMPRQQSMSNLPSHSAFPRTTSSVSVPSVSRIPTPLRQRAVPGTSTSSSSTPLRGPHKMPATPRVPAPSQVLEAQMRQTSRLCRMNSERRLNDNSPGSKQDSTPKKSPVYAPVRPWVPKMDSAPEKPLFHILAGQLDAVLGAGSILVSRNQDRAYQIGAMGGYFGHVMLVTEPPRRIEKGTVTALELQDVWPCHDYVRELWAVPIVESTRIAQGLREATLLLYVERPTGTIVVAGELDSDDELGKCEGDTLEIWQSPFELRDLMNTCQWRSVIMAEAYAEMKQDMRRSNWSEVTAVRAAFLPAGLDRNLEGRPALAQIQESWRSEPICTSVAIIFWQKVFGKLAPHLQGGPNPKAAERSMALIHRFMPLRADRSLPSEMCEGLMEAGWIHTPRLNLSMVAL